MIDQLDIPYIYEIEPTNVCPYKCIMCPRGLGQMTRAVGFMELPTFENIIRQMCSSQKLVRLHHFGEAVLHPDIHRIVRMINAHGFKSLISLNPATLNEKLIENLIESEISIVCFSLDALSDDGLFKIRGIRRSFKECWSMMERFIEMSRQTNQFILKVIQMVKLECNADDRQQFPQLKNQFPESDVYLYVTENTGFGDMNIVRQTLHEEQQPVSDVQPCSAPFSEISVLWNGDVVLCCYDYDGFNVIGNINRKSLAEIWQDTPVSDIRACFEKKETGRLPLCAGCFLAPHHFHADDLTLHRGLAEEQVIIQLFEDSRSVYH